jgi:2',3'-cyclic-nucleotide 2'-phosphodiesterase (5'-nucleotidase family)
MLRRIEKFLVLVFILFIAVPVPAATVDFSILHTNDFHGQLEYLGGSNPGAARLAQKIEEVRAEVGAENVLLVDAGDMMQGSLLSNIWRGESTIGTFNAMGYDVATIGNHEFDWGQTVLSDRASQATFPFVAANIVVNDTGNCATAGWSTPSFVQPYVIKTMGIAPDEVNVAFIGVTTTETPIITIASATDGLCFKDPADSIAHYYDTMKAAGADVIVVLSHLGYSDGGYGYGIPIYGDQTLANKLNTAGKPANLIIGGHSHTNLTSATTVGQTKVVQAYYNGRRLGRADIAVDTGLAVVNVAWTPIVVDNTVSQYPAVDDVVKLYANDPDYQSLINQEIGWTNVPIVRNYEGDSLMGYFVNDAIYNDLNTDGTDLNDVDMVFNNPGGLRADITCIAYPCQLTYGMMFTVLPFGNQTIVGDMTGEEILELLNQSASLNKGAIQPAGMRYSFYNYRVWPTLTTFHTWAWGAFDACVINKTSGVCEPLDLSKTYRVATNEFLAPAGQDNFFAFKYMTNITYWGDMLNGVNRWVYTTYTAGNPYNGALDGRITRDGNDSTGSVIPITILHHNDSHGNLFKSSYVGYTQLASLIEQERAYNPARTLLLNAGDQIQGDAMMYYFKSSYSGFGADGTPLPASLQTNPMMAVMNAMNYDAMTLGNHEFNFGSDTFKGILGQAQFPILGANISDTGEYGLDQIGPGAQGVKPYLEKTIDGIKVAVLGITNHRVPNYELPSNIGGLTFSDPIVKAQELSTQLRSTNDIVVALTHIGFTEDPKSVEVDKNVDTNMASTVTGLNAIVGGHSHTNPANGFGSYKYLPTIVEGPDNTPVIISQAYRYNNTLGQLIIGLRPKAGGGYEVVSRAGQYIPVVMSTTPEDAAVKAIVDPYVSELNAYLSEVVGQTTVPIDTMQAFTQETNGANLQVDSSVYELAQHGMTDVDFHLSGAMTNRKVADSATPATPFTLKVSDMFQLMPYENSLVVIQMNGPQLKAVLERAYRNYYYYKYVPGYGGYSYYTTCMIDINDVGRIYYKDTSPALPDGNNVMGLVFNGKTVDFTDASTYYNVSTVNYLAAGSCNFNDSGVTLWPLNQIVHDTQYYVRDSVINYVNAMGTVSPAVEGRLLFGDTVAPVITINAPAAQNYMHPDFLTLDFSAVDGPDGTTPSFAAPSGVKNIQAILDGMPVTNGQVINLYALALGNHTLTVTAADFYGNNNTKSVTFSVAATIQSLKSSVNLFYQEGKIDSAGIRNSLLDKLNIAEAYLNQGNIKAAKNALAAFIKAVKAQKGIHITSDAASLLIADAQWVINHL